MVTYLNIEKTITGGSVERIKNTFEELPLNLDLSVKRIPTNLLMETTKFNLDGTQFAHNSRLRLSILDIIGVPQELIIPLVLEFETGKCSNHTTS